MFTYSRPAEKANVLSTYLERVKHVNKSYSMYDIATGNVNTRAAGQKGGKPRRVRKAPQATSSSTISSKKWLLGIPPDHTDHMVSLHSFDPNSALPVDRNTPLLPPWHLQSNLMLPTSVANTETSQNARYVLQSTRPMVASSYYPQSNPHHKEIHRHKV